MSQDIVLPQDMAADIVAKLLEHLADWPIRSAEAFRNALLGDGLFAINPLFPVREEEEVMFLRSTVKNTVAEGRMIDFGFIPNAVIREESERSRHIFEAGELQHPYESWLAVTAWEGGYNGYHISPNPKFPGEILVIELYGVAFPQVADAVLVYDIVSIKAKAGNTQVAPTRLQYAETEQQIRARGSNSLDPLVTMLRLLADASVPVTVYEAPPKLNRNRARQDRFAIPGHTVVHTKDYVASFHAAAGKRHGAGNGTHASPIAHWRRAHQRHLASGQVVPVRSSKVNWRDTQELHRLFYRVK